MRRILIVLGLGLTVPGPARAHDLTTAGGGGVVEASYHLDLEVRGLFATAEARQRVVATTADPMLAVYTFQLPGDAAVTGFEIALGDAAAQAGVIATEAGAIPLDGTRSSEIGDDLGTLAQVAHGRPRTADDPGTPSTFLYTAYPVRTGGATITVRWIMAIRLEQGRAVIDLPIRTGADLAPIDGTIRFAPIAGLTAPRGVRVGGVLIAKAPGAQRTAFTVAAGRPLVIEAEIAARGHRPVFLADKVALRKGRGAIAAAVVMPAPTATRRATTADRLLVVIDASRSMRRIDRAQVVAAVRAIIASAPAATQLEAIGFDRTAYRVFGDWRDNDARTQTALADKVAGLGDANGSNLPAAFAEAAAAIDPARATQIVIVTDGGIDLAIDADALVAALGDRAAAVDVVSLVAVPHGRTVPVRAVFTLSDVARRLGGMVRIARVDDLADRAARLAIATTDGGAWTAAASVRTDLGFPEVIAPGDGATAIGWYSGAPTRAELSIDHGGNRISVAATSAGIDAAALALAGSDVPNDIERLRAAAARKHGVVSPVSTAIVVDASTALGRDRRALIARGAPWARLPPPPERDLPFEITDAPVPGPAPGGTIDGDTIRNLLTLELVARLRACYQRALTRDSTLRGRVMIDFLMGDGEVISATALGAREPGFADCVVEAAHQIRVPVVADDTLIRVRYPVDFTVAASESFVVLGDADSAEPLDPSILPHAAPDPVDLRGVDLDDPLGGMPH